MFLAVADRNALDARPGWDDRIASLEELAAYLGAIENGASYGDLAGDRGVGTHGGSQDHTAILCAVPGHVVGYRFGPVQREASVPLGDRVFVIGASGITASKAGEHRERYNQAVEALQALLGLWRTRTGEMPVTLGALLEEGPETVATAARASSTRRRRARCPRRCCATGSITSSPRRSGSCRAPTRALAAGDFATFGTLVDESQHLAEQWLGNQIPETSALARLARRLGADGRLGLRRRLRRQRLGARAGARGRAASATPGAPPTKPSSRCSPAAPRSSAATPAPPSCGCDRPRDGPEPRPMLLPRRSPRVEKRRRNCTTARGRFVDNGPGGPGQLSMALKTIDVTRTTTPRPRPDEAQLGFGKYFADHMLLVEYGPQGWSEPRIVPYGPLSLDPAASVLHYGQAMFEGLKAFRHANGRVALFRVDDNLKRLASGAPRLSMPVPDVADAQGGDRRARRRRQGLGARRSPAPRSTSARPTSPPSLPRRAPGDPLPALRDHLAGRRLLRLRPQAGEDLGGDRGRARRPRRHRLGQGRGQLRRQHEGGRRRALARLRAGAVARRASSTATSRRSAR